jgi:hypothetical protein
MIPSTMKKPERAKLLMPLRANVPVPVNAFSRVDLLLGFEDLLFVIARLLVVLAGVPDRRALRFDLLALGEHREATLTALLALGH